MRRTVRILGYTRLSDDPQGKKVDHKTQRRHIRERVAREGWPSIAEEDWFRDTDRSANDPSVVRKGWMALLDVVRAADRRSVKVIVIGYNQERLIRQLADLTPVADLIELKHAELWSVKQGHVNTTKAGRTAYYLDGVISTSESEKTGSRAYDGMTTAAMEGRPHAGAGYGWDRIYPPVAVGRPQGRNVINREQAKVVQDIARRVAKGGSLSAISRELNERRVPAPGAGTVIRRDPETKQPVRWASDQWCPRKIRQLLLRKANVGIRKHRAADSAEDGGLVNEYAAQWSPILDEKTYAQVVAILSDGDRRTSTSNVARHLLSHIAVCGVCGKVVTSQQTRKKGVIQKVRAYRCHPETHVVKTEDNVDRVVVNTLLEWVTRPEVRAALVRSDDSATTALMEEAAALRAEVANLEEDRAKRVVTREQFNKLNQRWQAELAAAEAGLRRRLGDGIIGEELLSATDVRAAWKVIPLDRQRAIIDAWLTVTLYPTALRGRNSFDPSTVVVEPKLRDD